MFSSFARTVQRLAVHEPVERWWEIRDDCLPLTRASLPSGYQLTGLPAVPYNTWRSMGWPDRPHP